MKVWQNAPKWAKNVITYGTTFIVSAGITIAVYEIKLANAIKEQRKEASWNFNAHCEDDVSRELSMKYWGEYHKNLAAIKALKQQSCFNYGKQMGED
ncbi:MAG: hypothetical protein FWE50_01140 [Alphaproteobacteria bacterium]|nr:hypothetical protein [Alphaproteobacteria bacterium]